MRIVISPAKSLDWESPVPKITSTQPAFTDRAAQLIDILRTIDEPRLSRLMDISPALAALNTARYRQWNPDHRKKTRPAIYAFDGDVYTGLDAYTMDAESVKFAQKHLRILSGLYGILKPLDKIHPYRLEMGTPLMIHGEKGLYHFWGEIVTNYLNNEMNKKKDVLINLASEEYFKVIRTQDLNARIITPSFYDLKEGQYKMISFFAKKARGAMARYIIDHRIRNVSELKGFDTYGYLYSEPLSKGDKMVFIRG